MTTLSYPVSNVGSILIGAIAGATAMLILIAALAIAALNAPVSVGEPQAAPAPMTNQANSDDLTPLSGVLEFAD